MNNVTALFSLIVSRVQTAAKKKETEANLLYTKKKYSFFLTALKNVNLIPICQFYLAARHYHVISPRNLLQLIFALMEIWFGIKFMFSRISLRIPFPICYSLQIFAIHFLPRSYYLFLSSVYLLVSSIYFVSLVLF